MVNINLTTQTKVIIYQLKTVTILVGTDTSMFYVREIGEFDVEGFFKTAKDQQITPLTTAKHPL